MDEKIYKNQLTNGSSDRWTSQNVAFFRARSQMNLASGEQLRFPSNLVHTVSIQMRITMMRLMCSFWNSLMLWLFERIFWIIFDENHLYYTGLKLILLSSYRYTYDIAKASWCLSVYRASMKWSYKKLSPRNQKIKKSLKMITRSWHWLFSR